jgi:hypothetical protein
VRAPWQVIEWRYVLESPDSGGGRFVFFPFVARVSGPGARTTEARSNPWTLVVRAPPVVRAPVAIGAPPRPRGGAGIEVHARLTPGAVYVGQQATYALSVLVDERVRDRLRRNPEFVPPDLRGVLAYDLTAAQRTARANPAAGRGYDVHVFERALFALQPGVLEVPAATLSYSLPLGGGFFSREESRVLRSEALRLVVREPPVAGRPRDWTGAVGRLRAAARVDTTATRVGDAVVYTLRVEGEGNVPLLPRPTLRVPGAALIPSGERVMVDSSSTRVRGAKEFDWLLTPQRAGELAVPAARYAFFDPEAARYEVAIADALAVRVLPGSLAGSPGGAALAPAAVVAALAVRTTWTGERSVPLASRSALWALALAAPLPLLAALALRASPRRHDTAAGEPTLAQLVARGDGSTTEPRAVRRALLAALAARLGLPPGALGTSAARVRVLRRCGLTAQLAREVDALVSRLDAAAFAGRNDASPLDARSRRGRAGARCGRVAGARRGRGMR